MITHGDLGKGLLSTVSMLVQDNDMLESIGFFPGQGAEDLQKKIVEKLDYMNSCEGVLCFVDMLGGTPSNVVSEFVVRDKNQKIKLVAGVNLPILIEAIALRYSMKLPELVSHILGVGKNSIIDVGEILLGGMKSS